jgi:hypothetical protein
MIIVRNRETQCNVCKKESHVHLLFTKTRLTVALCSDHYRELSVWAREISNLKESE